MQFLALHTKLVRCEITSIESDFSPIDHHGRRTWMPGPHLLIGRKFASNNSTNNL